MTEFTKPRFSVPLGGKAFSEGYDRAFKKKKVLGKPISVDVKTVRKIVDLKECENKARLKAWDNFVKRRKGKEK